MRIDRLLGIVIYLLNRDIVNANMLAEKFEVSSRTIQRDIETLSLAGIPIVSLQGINGGYGIIDTFKLDKQITTKEDYQFIKTALDGLSTAYDSKKLEQTFEKILSRSEKENKLKIKLDFSVCKEGHVQEYQKIVSKAIEEKLIIQYVYSDSCGNKTLRKVEPIGMVYKWYAWYMLGYCLDKNDYRLFKLVRMRKLRILDQSFSYIHDSFEKLLNKHEQQNIHDQIDVKLLGKKEIRVSVEEYFPNGKFEELENGDFLMEITLPNNEKGWKGLLLTYGNKIKILEPDELKDTFKQIAQEIINIYC